MTRADDPRVCIVTGALGGLVLGIALIPLRSLTSASNLAFVFIAFTIIVAELGGRAAALVTATVLTLSLTGGRLPLAVGGRTMAMDLWEGDTQGFGANEVRALAIAAALIGVEVSRRHATDGGR